MVTGDRVCGSWSGPGASQPGWLGDRKLISSSHSVGSRRRVWDRNASNVRRWKWCQGKPVSALNDCGGHRGPRPGAPAQVVSSCPYVDPHHPIGTRRGPRTGISIFHSISPATRNPGNVNGRRDCRVGGLVFSGLADSSSPGGRTGGSLGGVSVEGRHPLAGEGFGEPVAVAFGSHEVGVVQQPIDGRGRGGLGHERVEPGRGKVAGKRDRAKV